MIIDDLHCLDNFQRCHEFIVSHPNFWVDPKEAGNFIISWNEIDPFETKSFKFLSLKVFRATTTHFGNSFAPSTSRIAFTISRFVDTLTRLSNRASLIRSSDNYQSWLESLSDATFAISG